MSRTNSSTLLETISKFDKDWLAQDSGKDWAHDASMDHGTYEATKSFVSAMIESESDNSSSSMASDDDAMEVEPVPVRHYAPGQKMSSSAVQRNKVGVPQSLSKSRTFPDGPKELSDFDDNETDPETCAFKIPCAMRKSDGSYSPFAINSTTTLHDLHDAVGEKLGQHPNTLQLQYKLSNDKVKAPATSIEDESELEIFIMKMRALIVPLCLATGKLSKRGPPKNLMVCFEDGMMEEKKTGNADGKGKKMAGHDAYCHPNTSTGVCYCLSLQDLGLWSNAVVKNMATIEEKPATILLHDARTTKIRSMHLPDLFQGAAPFGTMGGHGITIPIVLCLEWGQYQQILSMQPAGNQVAPPPLPPAVKISVEIEQWFQEFKDNPLRNMKGFKFLEFSRVLKSQGFTQITQLSQSFITIQDLQGVLKIDMGTAIFIMDYT
ncbi:hypothetical protein F5148DRAFT_1152556 [Russula earlei]|uniref:Uncharacterized protein n=1 Tax=Russula earlei TaxID=71964 RepID=A0ACC0TVV2_9AGAM|nr:hypothetical protein F5148DRAFT_1152556 [Russula earlei]